MVDRVHINFTMDRDVAEQFRQMAHQMAGSGDWALGRFLTWLMHCHELGWPEPLPPFPPKPPRPPRNPDTLHGPRYLSEDAVRAIRASTDSGPSLARRYGVTRSTISHIRTGKTWRQLRQDSEAPPHGS